jgi:phosphatidylserine decarboxylase
MKIVREGWPFIIGCLIVTYLFFLGSIFYSSHFCMALASLGFIATLFCAYFFRDPPRVVPQGEHLILSPADGKILEIIEGTDPISTEPIWILRIFLSVFEPHLQRSPVAGVVKKIEYKRGKFLDARDPKAPFENEQNRIEIGGVVVTQIAGLIARRIVCWVREEQRIQAGERIGLIRFGSQVDMVFPKKVTLKVKAGDFVRAGETVIAEKI